MRIRALRVREFCCFDGAVAVEGLSGRLDVLVGPNERGKSTLFHALETVFELKHSATGRQIDALRPWAGGDPTIEVDFETGDGLWRITKRYGRSRMAELTDLKLGRLVARNADADDRLDELLGGRGGAGGFDPRRGLLWVGQSMGLAPESLKGERGDLVTRLISREVEAAGGGRRAREALRRARAELDQLVTDARGKPKAGGRLAAAMAWRERVRGIKAQADAAAASAQAAIDRLDRLETRRREIEAPGRRQELEQRVVSLRHQHEAGQAARQSLATKDAELEAATLARDKANEDLARFDAGLSELARLTEHQAQIAGRLAGARTELDRHVADIAAAHRRLDAATDSEKRLRQHAEIARAAAALADLTHRVGKARGLAAQFEDVRLRRGAVFVTAGMLAAIEREARDIDAIAARLAAGAPKIRVAYLSSAQGRIRLDGRPLGDGETVSPAGPLRLEIDGIGSIEIAPADDGGGRAEDLDSIARHQGVLKELLARAHVPDIAAARAASETGAALERDVAALVAELGVVAPQGLAVLEREHARLERAAEIVEAAAPTEPWDPGLAAAELAAAERTTAEARRALEALTRESAALQQKAAADDARLASVKDQLGALEKGLPAAEVRSQARADLEKLGARSQALLARVLEERMVLQRRVPSSAELERLGSELTKATAALGAHDGEVQSTRVEIARLEAEIAALADRGEAARVEEVTEELAAAQATVARIEEEVEVLRLLAATIDGVLTESRDRFLAPVVRRIGPALVRLLPGARLTFDASLNPRTLERGHGRSEAIGSLSSGTQEQIAVLVRLALADLLADQGMETPVVLDDALVYADDDRIEAMFREIERAAQKHQVIVLTCRSRTFERLGGKRLTIGGWS